MDSLGCSPKQRESASLRTTFSLCRHRSQITARHCTSLHGTICLNCGAPIHMVQVWQWRAGTFHMQIVPWVKMAKFPITSTLYSFQPNRICQNHDTCNWITKFNIKNIIYVDLLSAMYLIYFDIGQDAFSSVRCKILTCICVVYAYFLN